MEKMKQFCCWVKAVRAVESPAPLAPSPAPELLEQLSRAIRGQPAEIKVGTEQIGVPPPPTPPGSGDAADKSTMAATDEAAADTAAGDADAPPPTAPPMPTGPVNIGVPPPPRDNVILAGASFMGLWKFDMVRKPQAGEAVLGWQPVLGTRADAMAWLASAAGQAWAADAMTIELVIFHAFGDI